MTLWQNIVKDSLVVGLLAFGVVAAGCINVTGYQCARSSCVADTESNLALVTYSKDGVP